MQLICLVNMCGLFLQKTKKHFNAFQKLISLGRKPNKLWVDQGNEYCNNSFKDFLKINNIEIYSIYNKGKSVVAEIH